MTRPRRPRRGAALLVAVVALAVVGVLAASITWQVVAGRRQLDRREYQLQAEWLARAGLERAAARLLADPSDYREESVALIPDAKVRVTVREADGLFRVTSEARYPGSGREAVTRSATRTFRRTARDGRVRLEAVHETRPSAPDSKTPSSAR